MRVLNGKLVCLLVTFSTFNPFTATTGQAKVFRLLPSPGSDIILDKVTAKIASDGTVKYRIRGTHSMEVGPVASEISHDINRRTYSTHWLDIEAETGRKPRAYAGGVSPARCTLITKVCTAKVEVQTWEPLSINLATTRNFLKWQVNANGTVSFLDHRRECIPTAVTALGTHWFNSSCFSTPTEYPSTDGINKVKKVAWASYYNWDFGLPNFATYANHAVDIRGRNDLQYGYIGTSNHSGESWFLLVEKVFLNNFN